MRKAIYTVNLGGYDREPVPHRFKGWDSVVISDSKIHSSSWTRVIYVDPTNNPDIESRRYKWLSHKYLPEYDMVLYHDANMRLRSAPPDGPFRIKHGKRSTVKEEAEACNKQIHRCSIESINAEYEYFMQEGFTDDVGLYLNGLSCRLHDEETNRLCELVFDTILRFTPRDQIALPYAIWKLDYKVPEVKPVTFYTALVVKTNHRVLNPKIYGLIPEPLKVHHITPGRSDKNFGKSINDIINLLPEEDWVCLRDIDTIPMYHEVFFDQCEQIAKSGKFDLIGCMTNRLGFAYQLHNGVKSNEGDIMKHREIAVELYDKHGVSVKPINNTIGGMFMLFSKKTWLTAGKFLEGKIFQKNAFIDFHFSKAVLRKRLKVGIAQGIYLFHYYRFHHGNDTRSAESKQHLITAK